MNYATQVLRHNVIVPAIEHLFVPVLILTSTGTKHDAAMLKEFNEPAWNNPVCRFLDADRKDLIPRKDGVYKPAEIAKRMLEALDKAGAVLAADARQTLESVAAGREVSTEDAQKFADAISSKITRKLAPALAGAVKAYESREYGKAVSDATKARDKEKATEAEKADADYLIALVSARWESTKARASNLKSQREYLPLFELVADANKHFEGVAGHAEWQLEMRALEKDKLVKNEVNAAKKLVKLEQQLESAKTDRDRDAIKKQLEKFASDNQGTLAAEKAAALAK